MTPLSKNISRKGPRKCRSLGCARDDKRNGDTFTKVVAGQKARFITLGARGPHDSPRRDENGVRSATAFNGTATVPFVIPSGAEGSAVQRTRPGNVLTRFENQVCVGYSVGCPDESNGLRDALLEDHMRFVGRGHAVECRHKRSPCLGRVLREKLFGHESSDCDEVFPQSLYYVEDLGYVVDERNVDGFNLWPEWKTPVRDDQGIRVPDAAGKRVDSGIQDACLEHANRVT
jgi:hypothetical protein